MTSKVREVKWTFNERLTEWRIPKSSVSLRSNLSDPLWRVYWDGKVVPSIKGFEDLAKAKASAENFATSVGELK